MVPRLGPDVPQWFGDTIGFWDGEALITWTSNIQGWISHGGFEFSNRLQSIEIYTPRKDPSGTLIGLTQETVLYDAEAFAAAAAHRSASGSGSVAGTRATRSRSWSACRKVSRWMAMPPRCRRADVSSTRVPDIYGRPWAQIWERDHEKGMTRPAEQKGRFGL